MTSFLEDFVIRLNPWSEVGDGVNERETKVDYTVWLSYWPEHHYNSISKRLPQSDESLVAFVPSGLHPLHFL